MYDNLKDPRDIRKHTEHITELSLQIQQATEFKIRELARIPMRGLYIEGSGIKSESQSISNDLDALSKAEREAKRELLQAFADLFYDLQMSREWLAITVAMDIMRREDENNIWTST